MRDYFPIVKPTLLDEQQRLTRPAPDAPTARRHRACCCRMAEHRVSDHGWVVAYGLTRWGAKRALTKMLAKP